MDYSFSKNAMHYFNIKWGEAEKKYKIKLDLQWWAIAFQVIYVVVCNPILLKPIELPPRAINKQARYIQLTIG